MRNKTLLFALLLVTVPTVVYAQPAKSSYIGYKYKSERPSNKLPNGVTHFGGGLIGDIDADPVFGIAQVAKGKTGMLWLEYSTGRDSTGVTGWEVLDVLSFPQATKADQIFFTGDPAISCTRKGQEIPNLVGIGRVLSRTRGVFKPSKLWIANIGNKKFEPLRLTGVTCIYSEP